MIDPQAQAVLDDIAAAGANEPEPQDAAQRLAKARRDTNALVRFSGPMPAIDVERRTVEGRHGVIPVEIYRRAPGRLPLLVWCHGGGAIAGSIDTHRVPLARIAEATGWAVASIGYRLAPEHRFPVPHEDCLDAVAALAGEADDGLALGGDSIGGLFATTVARLCRDRGGPRVDAQILLYPNTDLRQDRDFASLSENDGRIMTRASLGYEADRYVPAIADRALPLASPLLALDLAGLPPALVVTCGADPLRDEGDAYAAALREAGVPVDHRVYPGMIHAVVQMGGAIDAAHDMVRDIADFLRSPPSSLA